MSMAFAAGVCTIWYCLGFRSLVWSKSRTSRGIHCLENSRLYVHEVHVHEVHVDESAIKHERNIRTETLEEISQLQSCSFDCPISK